MCVPYLLVESRNVQASVSCCILGWDVSSEEQQLLQVLQVAVAAGLETQWGILDTAVTLKTCTTLLAGTTHTGNTNLNPTDAFFDN